MGRLKDSTYHVSTRLRTCEEHVGGDTSENVANEQDGDTSLVLWPVSVNAQTANKLRRATYGLVSSSGPPPNR